MDKQLESFLKNYRKASDLNKSNLMRIMKTLGEDCEAREKLREWLYDDQFVGMTGEAVSAYLDSIGA